MFSSRTKKNRIRVCSPCTHKFRTGYRSSLFFVDWLFDQKPKDFQRFQYRDLRRLYKVSLSPTPHMYAPYTQRSNSRTSEARPSLYAVGDSVPNCPRRGLPLKCSRATHSREQPSNRNTDTSEDLRSSSHIRSIVKYKQALQQYDGWETNPQYLRTVQYLADHCPHEFVTDWVDIDPDRSQPITYCPRCETCR